MAAFGLLYLMSASRLPDPDRRSGHAKIFSNDPLSLSLGLYPDGRFTELLSTLQAPTPGNNSLIFYERIHPEGLSFLLPS